MNCGDYLRVEMLTVTEEELMELCSDEREEAPKCSDEAAYYRRNASGLVHAQRIGQGNEAKLNCLPLLKKM